jgi:hypothetical protein
MAKRKQKRPGGPAGNPDYVELGSEQHAATIGLVPATEQSTYKLADSKGREWTLADTTAWGPQATDTFIKEVLRQKVSTLNTAPIPPQSKDRFAPGYAPPIMRYQAGAD